MKRSLIRLVCAWVSVSALACGGSPRSAETAETESDSVAVPEEGDNAGDAELPESDTGSEAEPATAESDATAPADAKPAPRELHYTPSPDGLRVTVEGLNLVATAEPVKQGSGWGLRVKLEGKVVDDAEHNFLWPEQGPLAFAGSVTRRGQKARFGDKRETEGEKVVSSGETFSASREWPGTIDVKPLKAGDSLELEVGLWGFGSDAESRRPVRDFLLIRMTAGKNTPQPLVQPPASAVQ